MVHHTLATRPSVPFEHHFLQGFRSGKTLLIRGRAEYHRSSNDSFAINLGIDPHHHQNIALHINPRHKQGKIVLNSLIGGEWGKEEHHTNKIGPEQHFELSIRADDHHYHIEVNGHHLGDFKYRVPTPLVNHIDIEGGVHIETIELIE